MPAEVQVSGHPLLLHQLTLLRDRTTAPPLFRQLVAEMARQLFYEATRDLPLRSAPVQTPLAECAGQSLAEAIALVPILRAGLGMAEALLAMAPSYVIIFSVHLYTINAHLFSLTNLFSGLLLSATGSTIRHPVTTVPSFSA